ncbi:MAG: rRNA maturation RNase YbeY [Patescibacteria group bacterium]
MSRVFIGYGNYGIDGVDEEFIRFIFDITLGSTQKTLDSEAGVIIADEEQIAKLNHRYRGKDQSTNVLSFTNTEMKGSYPTESDDNYLGDVYICHPILQREAEELKVSEKERFAQLFVHGLLHLLGFDHEDTVAAKAKEMEVLEDRIVQLVM